MNDISKHSYFQYQKDLDLPVFIRVDLTQLPNEFVNFLVSQHFSEVSQKVQENLEKRLTTDANARLLTIQLASPKVLKKINGALPSDSYGPESIVPNDGYRVYRYRKQALMVYSFAAQEWQLGVARGFTQKEAKQEAKTVLNRFLSLALAPLGIIGFWGVQVDEGVVVLNRSKADGNVVYLDVLRKLIYSPNGNKQLTGSTQIIKLDKTLAQDRQVTMTSEELISFISVHCTYLDYPGLSRIARQLLQDVAIHYSGMIVPQVNFTPRPDLSL